ncbi:hypothetical protein [Arcanobacterium phocae]|uniref:hypothetical protein n=1 Tax=Arcanobacterium phocae TaxID=131112 RepID=UPI001C0EA5D2|nr:hypothetical protein [Arcanobacterium phocae]
MAADSTAARYMRWRARIRRSGTLGNQPYHQERYHKLDMREKIAIPGAYSLV